MTNPTNAVDRPSGRWYIDPHDPDVMYVSVTTVIGATAGKPWLAPWSARLAAEYAVEQHALIGTLLEQTDGAEAAVGLIKGVADRRRDDAADRGSLIHALAESLARDIALPALPDDDPDAAGLADALVAFFADHEPEVVYAEATVCSRRYRYAGTADGFWRLPKLPGAPLCLVDVKTGSKVDGDVALQLAGYRNADEVWLRTGQKAPMPRVERTLVLHLRADGTYRLLNVNADRAAFDALLQAMALFGYREARGRRSVGPVIHIPGQPIPVVDVEGLGRCRGALAAAGLKTLQQIAAYVAEQDGQIARLAELPGVGPAAVEAVTAALDAYGLRKRDGAE